MASPKTVPVVLPDGTAGRAVEVTAKNAFSVARWTGGELSLAHDVETGKETEHKVRLHAKAGIRVARVGDTVVKDSNGKFHVFKADDLRILA